MAVHRLARGCPGLVTATSTYLTSADEVLVDLAHTRRIARQILCTSGAPSADLIAAAVRANWCDDLLPEWTQEWLVEYRTRYRQLRLTTLEQLAHVLSVTGRHGAAVHLALTAVQSDALRDSAHKTLIEAFIAQGNRHEADTHFAAYQRIFRDEPGVEPAESIEQLLRSP
jgi:two-component SAPR family response regulator